MLEIPICIYCRKSVSREFEDYVVTNKDETTFQNEWLYAHVDCHNKAMESKKQER